MRYLALVFALAACNSSQPPGEFTPEACKSCADLVIGYCAASGECDSATSCEWGFITSDSKCDEPQLYVETALPIDCRREQSKDDPRCASPASVTPGTCGHGVNIDRYELGGGFIDTAQHRLVMAFSCDLCIGDDTGVLAVDLGSGDRTLLSGRIDDPLQGMMQVGTGEIPTSLNDVQLAPSGRWIALDNTPSGAEIYEIDPATGARTVLYQQAQLDAYDPAHLCSMAGYGLNVGWAVPTASHDGGANLALGADGTIYARASRGGTPSEDLGIEGLVALRDGSCTLVTGWSYNKPELFHGNGPSISDYYGFIAERGGTIYAAPGQYMLQAVDAATGNRTALSSADPGAPLGEGGKLGRDFALLDGDSLWTEGGSDTFGGTVKVDLATGNRTLLLHQIGTRASGDKGPLAIYPDLPGILIVASSGFELFEPATGNRNLLSR